MSVWVLAVSLRGAAREFAPRRGKEFHRRKGAAVILSAAGFRTAAMPCPWEISRRGLWVDSLDRAGIDQARTPVTTLKAAGYRTAKSARQWHMKPIWPVVANASVSSCTLSDSRSIMAILEKSPR